MNLLDRLSPLYPHIRIPVLVPLCSRIWITLYPLELPKFVFVQNTFCLKRESATAHRSLVRVVRSFAAFGALKVDFFWFLPKNEKGVPF